MIEGTLSFIIVLCYTLLNISIIGSFIIRIIILKVEKSIFLHKYIKKFEKKLIKINRI
jgi:hypothetical protein